VFGWTLADSVTDEDSVNPGYPDMQSISIKQAEGSAALMAAGFQTFQPLKPFQTLMRSRGLH